MTNALKEAISEIERLPAAAQDKIGEDLLLHLDKLRQLRAKIQQGIGSLERGEGRELEVEEVIRSARAHYGKA